MKASVCGPTRDPIANSKRTFSNSGPELLVTAAVNAFFDQNLYAAAKELLAHAEGSFGLCLSTSIDAANEVVLAARGQTMSIAFWPKLGVLTYRAGYRTRNPLAPRRC